MLYINDWSIKELKKHFCSYKINPWSPSGSWQTSRHIQIFIDGYIMSIVLIAIGTVAWSFILKEIGILNTVP